MTRMKDADVGALPPGLHAVDGCPGFVVRVRDTGRRVFLYRYRIGGRRRYVTIGPWPNLSLGEARHEWAKLSRDRILGQDPAEDRRRQKEGLLAPTVRELVAAYLERHARPNKRTWREDERIFTRDVLPRLGSVRAGEVTPQEVVAILDRIRGRGAPIMANRTLAAVRKLYRWGMGVGIVSSTPTEGIPTPSREVPRERVLTPAEIGRLWHGLGPSVGASHTTAASLRFCLATGQRIGEVVGMAHGAISEASGALTWTIPAASSKSGREHRVPLSSLACEILGGLGNRDGGFVFPGRGASGHLTVYSCDAALRRARADLDLPRVRPHDLRRTAATGLARLRVPRETIGRVLGHADRGVTGRVYDRWAYEDEKREALDRWAEWLGRVIQETGAASREDDPGHSAHMQG